MGHLGAPRAFGENRNPLSDRSSGWRRYKTQFPKHSLQFHAGEEGWSEVKF